MQLQALLQVRVPQWGYEQGMAQDVSQGQQGEAVGRDEGEIYHQRGGHGAPRQVVSQVASHIYVKNIKFFGIFDINIISY